MNLGHLKTNHTKFILQLALIMTLFLGSTVVHSVMHVVTQDEIFESEHHKCKSLKNIAASSIETEPVAAIAPRLFTLLPYASYVPHSVYTFWSRGPPKT